MTFLISPTSLKDPRNVTDWVKSSFAMTALVRSTWTTKLVFLAPSSGCCCCCGAATFSPAWVLSPTGKFSAISTEKLLKNDVGRGENSQERGRTRANIFEKEASKGPFPAADNPTTYYKKKGKKMWHEGSPPPKED